MLATASLLLALCGAAHAEPEDHALQNTRALPLTGEFVGSIFLGFMLPDLVLAPPPEQITCDIAWCEPPGIDRWFRNLVALEQPRTAGHVSHVFTIGLTPAAAIGGSVVGAVREGKGSYTLQDTVIIIDAWMLATGLNSIAKETARRQRPAYYFGVEDRTEAADHPDEEFLSFYSGDTTWAWTLAASGTTLAYLRGYEHARWVAIGTGSLAFVGSFLRMSGDMHWLTDVGVGTVSGVVVGAGLPLLMHRPKSAGGLSVSTRASDQGAVVSLQGSW